MGKYKELLEQCFSKEEIAEIKKEAQLEAEALCEYKDGEKVELGKFKDLAEKRFSKEKIAQMNREVALEAEAMRSLQTNIKEALDLYMEQQKIGFNEVVRRLGSTPRQIAQIQKGNSNLRMSTLAHIAAMLGQTPMIMFKKK